MTGLQRLDNNVYGLSFKTGETQQRKQQTPVYTNPEILNPQRQQVSQRDKFLREQEKNKKPGKWKNDLSWGVGILASTVMLVFFGIMLHDNQAAKRKEKEAARLLDELARDAAEELKQAGKSAGGTIMEQVAKIKNPAIKQAAANELAKPMGSSSELKLKELISLDAIDSPELKPVDLKKAAKLLDEKLVGMDEAKEPILRALTDYNLHLAKGTLPNKPIVIMLNSAPGQGKTTLARIIAEILDRPYGSISCAGRTGSSCIDGVQSQFVGADAGRIGQIHVQNRSKQNVILIDEIDKFGKSQEHGDPISAMLQMLDDRAAIEDQFLGVPVDVSQDVFIMTANDMTKLPEYFKNRLNPIFISPYGDGIKAGIAKLKLQELLKARKIEVNKIEEPIYDLIAKATDDAGGRQTTKKVEAIIEELATELQLGEVKEGSIEITEKLVKDLLDGKLPSIRERIKKSSIPTSM